jgi:DNA-binding transcriptional regulator GbsR (MarR family)
VAQDDSLRAAQDRFIATWGQMAGAWGISRTMAEVHALLYITGEAMNTDEVMERLEISRGNASMSLRALVDWSIAERVYKRGDRKEYFKAEQDVWTMFRAIVRERLKREVDPLLASLYEIRDATAKASAKTPPAKAPTSGADSDPRTIAEHNRRLDELLDFFRTIEGLGQRFVSPAGRGLLLAATLLKAVTPEANGKATPRDEG